MSHHNVLRYKQHNFATHSLSIMTVFNCIVAFSIHISGLIFLAILIFIDIFQSINLQYILPCIRYNHQSLQICSQFKALTKHTSIFRFTQIFLLHNLKIDKSPAHKLKIQ